MDKIELINQVIQQYFLKHKAEYDVPAKDLMPYFIKAGIFLNDVKSGLAIRDVLRKLDRENTLYKIPFVYADRKAVNTNWFFRRSKGNVFPVKQESIVKAKIEPNARKAISNRDEDYVLNLCDEVLKLKGFRQYKFDFLVGDSGRKLPVDIYFPSLNLVIEYRETQHSNVVRFFDKPDKMTVSGVSRGEQRKIYDQRRRDVLPKHGIKLLEIDYSDFSYDTKNRIVRDKVKDLDVVRGKLNIK